MAPPLEDVYCTLVMSDSYLPGAAVLAHSLRDAGTKKKLAALITLDSLSADTITQLKDLYDVLIPVPRVRNPNPANLFLMDRADLAFAFTKINLWRQTQFRKIVYLDADIVVLRAPDELFDLDASFAAAPDVGWPDCFNTGVMVISPNMGDYWALQTLAATGDSFDGADQGLLNQYYEHKNWHRISFTYNCTPNAQYQWEPAYRHFKRDISMVHFIGKDKPWVKGRQSIGSGVYNELLGRWWATYDRHLRAPSAADHPPSSKQQAQGEPAQIPEPEAITITTEQPMTETGEHPEKIEPVPAEQPPSQERAFSAPHMEWDATRSAPPLESRPEAANFPSQQYEFSESRALFQAPQSYPEPPKDMWYEVPKEKPKAEAAPPAIFPWERERERPRATRVFAEDLPLQPTEAVDAPPSAQSPSGSSDEDEFGRRRVTSPPAGSWEDFTHTSNAWDDVPGIGTYVRAIMDQSQGKKAPRPTGLTLPQNQLDIGSPTMDRKGRKESLLLTDFPTEVERPSLPVTPAPIRRPMFWGEDKAEAEGLPEAEGVPSQAEWNPEERLEVLRRSSLLELEHLRASQAAQQKAPEREMPAHAAPILHTTEEQPSSEGGPVTGMSARASVDDNSLVVRHFQEDPGVESSKEKESKLKDAETETAKALFTAPDFGSKSNGSESEGKASGSKEQDVLSPSEEPPTAAGRLGSTGLSISESLKEQDLRSPTER